jgi:hypothetical protein
MVNYDKLLTRVCSAEQIIWLILSKGGIQS